MDIKSLFPPLFQLPTEADIKFHEKHIKSELGVTHLSETDLVNQRQKQKKITTFSFARGSKLLTN